MDIWHIRGGNRLEGSCKVQGSKNASLPMLAASILFPQVCEFENLPELRDVDAALRILRHLGCKTERSGGGVYIDSRELCCSSIPHELMAEMRSSVIFMGALLGRCGEAELSLPGGCQLGKRPIDLHLASLRALGAEIQEDGGEISCKSRGLKGRELCLPFPSVGASENVLLSAAAAEGETVLHGAAREPEIRALSDCLRAMGVNISGDGTDCIHIKRGQLKPRVKQKIIPDRIVAASILCAAAGCGGEVELRDVNPQDFSGVLYFLKQAGCVIIERKRSLRLSSQGALKGLGYLSTAPYPGFPTDAQPVLMAAMLKARGRTLIRENIFENRYRQVPELNKLGADIRVSGRLAEIWGVESLHGASLRASDLRGGAAMIAAALSAQGSSLILDEGHVRRGYERYDALLRSLGGEIYLESEGNGETHGSAEPQKQGGIGEEVSL